MKNLLSLDVLTNDEIMKIIEDAEKFKNGEHFSLQGKTIANLFFEPSTRTQYSFNMAEELLDMKVITFNKGTSSFYNKGESFVDTIKTFEAFGVDALVIRHSEDRYYDALKDLSVPIINAGDGTKDHPTQTLLDLMTIYQDFHHFDGLKIAFVGDIKHSRVAHGGIRIMTRLGMDCYITGPNLYIEPGYQYIDLDEACRTMDVIMLLRVQNERIAEEERIDQRSYLERFGMTLERASMMKETSIIMHPAPFNRGIEIQEEVLNDSRCRIFKQMANGVYIRQSVLKEVFR